MDFDSAFRFLSERWERRSTPLFIILVMLLFLVPTAASIQLSQIETTWWITIGLVITGTLAMWWVTTRIKKIPKQKIGFIVAIQQEDPSNRTPFRNDFIRVLTNLIEAGELQRRFKLIELNQFHSSRVTSIESARKYLRKSRGHFILYGQVKQRSVNGKAHHFMSLRGAVTHAPIPSELSKSFSREFSSVLPHQMQIAKEGDVFVFEFTAAVTDLIGRYIIGVASLLSDDPRHAIELFEDLQHRLKTLDAKFPSIATLGVRLPIRLEEAYKLEISNLYGEWMITRDLELIRRMGPIIVKLQSLSPNDYFGHLLAAICAFLLDRDIRKAKKEIKQCRSQKDATWRYSKAFLLAYEGKLKQAISTYHEAFNQPMTNPNIPLQTEQFIIDILRDEPDKVQLHYCLGLINYHAKQDQVAAIKDFANFLSNCPQDTFAEERIEAGRYVSEIGALP